MRCAEERDHARFGIDEEDGRRMVHGITAVGGAGPMITATPSARVRASIDSRVPVAPTKDGSKCATYWPSTAGVSRPGSTLTNATAGRSPAGRSASAFRVAASVASVVGQMSGQFTKPKNTNVQRPRSCSGPNGWPDWSASVNAGSGLGSWNRVACSRTGGAVWARVAKYAAATPATSPAITTPATSTRFMAANYPMAARPPGGG